MSISNVYVSLLTSLWVSRDRPGLQNRGSIVIKLREASNCTNKGKHFPALTSRVKLIFRLITSFEMRNDNSDMKGLTPNVR